MKNLTKILIFSLVLVVFSVPAMASILPVKKHKISLNKEQLRDNIASRIRMLLKPKGVNLPADFGHDNIIIEKAIPAQIGSLELYAVKVDMKAVINGKEQRSTQNMIVDPTGSIQISDVREIATSRDSFKEIMRPFRALAIPYKWGEKLLTGQGRDVVYFVSDPFCPFCRQVYKQLLEYIRHIKELRIVHLPIEQLHPGATMTTMIMRFAHDTPGIDSKAVVDFAYTELEAPKAKNIEGAEREVLQKFITKFPKLSGKYTPEELYHLIKGKYTKKSQQTINEAQKLGFTGTPVTVIDRVPVHGANISEIKELLGK